MNVSSPSSIPAGTSFLESGVSPAPLPGYDFIPLAALAMLPPRFAVIAFGFLLLIASAVIGYCLTRMSALPCTAAFAVAFIGITYNMNIADTASASEALAPRPRVSIRLLRRDVLWMTLCFLPIVVAAFAVEPFPLLDSAFFEYVGHSMLRGQRLYLDVWDNKLPSIFLVNEGWQALFGQRYFLHVAAQAAVNALSVVLFAAILRRSGIVWWVPACAAFAVLIGFTDLNSCEQYALTCMLLAYVLALRGSTATSGIALAFATTFWIPAIVLGIPLLVRDPDVRSRCRFAVAFVATLVAYGIVMLAAFGSATVWELGRSWFWYVHKNRSEMEVGTRRHFGIIARVYSSFVISGVAALLAILLLVVRKPVNRIQSFAFWWSACSLAAPAMNGQFYAHYFLPALAPLLFTIATYGFTWPTVRSRIPLVLVAALFTWKFADHTARELTQSKLDASNSRVIGDRIQRALGVGSVVLSEPYAPEIYLASAASLPNRFAIVAPMPAMKAFIESREERPTRRAAVIVDWMRPNERPHLHQGKVLVCSRTFGGWEIYASPATSARFDCP